MSLKRQRNHQKHPFPDPKNLGGGNSKNMQRVFLVGRLRACPHRRRGLLTVPLELGSRESVKLHHFGKRTEIAALWGGFFSGGA